MHFFAVSNGLQVLFQSYLPLLTFFACYRQLFHSKLPKFTELLQVSLLYEMEKTKQNTKNPLPSPPTSLFCPQFSLY